ncbi:MAG: thioredoxin-like domain-containing protein [Flavobacteriales bacterium]|nr:redoxin domain-containing protein [Flavobacteriales bacterium]
MRYLFLLPALALHLAARAGSFSITVSTAGLDADVVTLYRYEDLFTQRTKRLARAMFSEANTATLSGEVSGTTKVQVRIGERSADLFIRPGSDLHVEASPAKGPRNIGGTARLELLFKDLDRMDVNALVADVNERIDAFLADDLATDAARGMQAVDIQRKAGNGARDTTQRPPTLFVTPVLSQERVDSFAGKLHRFYADVQDPWFAGYLEHSIAGLQFGPRVNDRSVYERYIKGGPVRYDDPEYVRTIRTLFDGALVQVQRQWAHALDSALDNGPTDSVVALFRRNDFLRDEPLLAELVAMDQLYLHYHSRIVRPEQAISFLRGVSTGSSAVEHRAIAMNMIWDLLTMRPGTTLPAMRLEDGAGHEVALDSLLKGPSCLVLTASWCTYCDLEMTGLEQLAQAYPGVMTIVVIDLDEDLETMKRYRRSHPERSFIWLHALAEQQVREDLRVRSLPTFLVLNDTVLAHAPAPLPSNGLGAVFQQAKVAREKQERIKVWDD